MNRSVSRKGDCWYNAVTETLFGSLKVERLHGMRFGTRRQGKVMDWLIFYNHRRLHSTLGYASPMAFEQKWLAGQISSTAWSTRQGRRSSRARAINEGYRFYSYGDSSLLLLVRGV